MSREMLDRCVPGWDAMTPLEFRWALGGVDAALRPALREALAVIVPAPEPAPVVEPDPPKAKATHRKGR